MSCSIRLPSYYINLVAHVKIDEVNKTHKTIK